jgi:hypothetical protein
MPVLSHFVNIFQLFLLFFGLLASFLATRHHLHFHMRK